MTTSSASSLLGLTVLTCSIVVSAKTPDQADPWLVLNKITHKRSYEIKTRDRKCVWVTIAEVGTDRLTAKVHTSNSSPTPVYKPASTSTLKTIAFPRADVLRVTSERTVYYSGRSSWSDVGSFKAKGRERLTVITTVGKKYRVRPPYAVSDDGITLYSSGKSTKLLKSEIAQVYEVVIKPLTATGEYLEEELGPMIIFDPDLYVYSLHLEQYVSVLLYNAGDPEDNSPAQCAPK